jgi:putative tricarboxylic transport membrane protein
MIMLASYVLWDTNHMPAGAPGQPGPGFFPTVLGAALLACSIGLLRHSWRTAAGEPITLWHAKVWITLAALVAVAFALEPLGFVAAGALFLVVLLRFCGGVRWPVAAVGALVLTFSAWYFFVAALGVALPRGVLPL